MKRVVKYTSKLTTRICKALYYIFIVWVIGVSTIGAYSVFTSSQRVRELEKSEERLTMLERQKMLEYEVIDLYERLGYRYSITLYKVTLETEDSPEKTDVISSIGNHGSSHTTKYWQNETPYDGYKEINRRIREEGTIYIEDVSKDNKIYYGMAKKDLERSKTKAIYGLLIRINNPTEAYGLIISSGDTVDITTPEFYLKTRESVKNIQLILKK